MTVHTVRVTNTEEGSAMALLGQGGPLPRTRVHWELHLTNPVGLAPADFDKIANALEYYEDCRTDYLYEFHHCTAAQGFERFNAALENVKKAIVQVGELLDGYIMHANGAYMNWSPV